MKSILTKSGNKLLAVLSSCIIAISLLGACIQPIPSAPAPTTGTVQVNATLDGSPWSGNIAYTLSGPQLNSGSTVADTFSGLPGGTYTLGYESGGPSAATLNGITPSPTQTLSPSGTVTFTLDFISQATSTIAVNALLDGVPWSGALAYTLSGPKTMTGSSVANTFSSLPSGTYTLNYQSGGPANAVLNGITPAATETVSTGQTVTFTFDFASQATSSVEVRAVLDGAPWSGTLDYTLSAPPQQITGTSVGETFSNLPSGTYTLGYQAGGPPGALLSGITPSSTQTVSTGQTVTFTFDFASEANNTIEVDATLDGSPWEGTVHYTVSGPVSDSDSFVPQTFNNLPAGTYTLDYRYGGPSGAVLTGISPSPTQMVSSGDDITFILRFTREERFFPPPEDNRNREDTRRISRDRELQVNVTLDGQPWSGPVHYSIDGPVPDSDSLAPKTFTSLLDGSYSLTYHDGGPKGSELIGIAPSPTQDFSDRDTITFSLNFSSQGSGTVDVEATLDGSPWSGTVNYTISGPRFESDSTAPQTFPDMPGGAYTLIYRGGGPDGAVMTGVTPSSRQPLSDGGDITFTLEFSSQVAGTVEVDATLDGSPWSGTVRYTISGPRFESDLSVPATFSDMPAGTYSLIYRGGGPEGARLSNITPSLRQSLSDGGDITFTLNFSREESRQ